ncbi:hypothetical protein OVA26_03040 [Microbacterium sp. SL62]|uniref:DUF7507 domain-containing protein n=1 Tax=Microbacterium sp. SL62 TaxID=2995139 RepID=UPI002273CAA9|nr:hypothetical protein [Microbacterium sp. SL62]MCY1715920.1 hypothetical protein [Microbacterium sp. SL62]
MTSATSCGTGPTIRIPLGAAATFPYTIAQSAAVIGSQIVNGDLVITLADFTQSTSGTIGLSLTAPNGTTVNGTTWTLQPTLTFSDGVTPSATAPAAVTSTATSSTFLNALNKSADKDFYRVGETVKYSIYYACFQLGTGFQNAELVTIVDTLPAGLTYVSSTPAAVVNGNTVTWTLTGNDIGFYCKVRGPGPSTLTVNATVDNGVASGTRLTNTVNATVDPIGNDPVSTGTTSMDVTVTDQQIPMGSVGKTATGPLRGGSATSTDGTYPGPWTSGTPSVPADVLAGAGTGLLAAAYRVEIRNPVQGMQWTAIDPMPCNSNASGVQYDSYSSSSGTLCTNPAFNPTYVTVGTSPINSSDTAVGVPSGFVPSARLIDGTTVPLTVVSNDGTPLANGPRAVLYQVPTAVVGQVAELIFPRTAGMDSRFTAIDIGGYVSDSRAGGDILRNRANVAFFAPGSDPRSASIGATDSPFAALYVKGEAQIGVRKSVNYAAIGNITWGVQGSLATRAPIGGGYSITDTFPADLPNLTIQNVTITRPGQASTTLPYTVTAGTNPVTGQQTRTVTFTAADINSLLTARGGRLTVAFTVAGAPDYAGTYTNTVAASLAGTPVDNGVCLDGATPRTGNPYSCVTSATATIQPPLTSDAVQLTKAVQGSSDTVFKTYPAIGVVPATGGTATYRLNWTNKSASPMAGVTLYDLLPRPGDHGTLASNATAPRGSSFQPALTAIGAIPTGVTLSYSTATNPCRDEVFPDAQNSGCVNDWSTTAPANLADVTALKLASSASYNFTEGIEFTYDVTTPMITPTQIAWNTVASAQTNQRTGSTVAPIESSKVGVAQAGLTHLRINKTLNTAPEAVVPNGVLDYTVTVTNDGTTDLHDVVATDTIPAGTTIWYVPQATSTTATTATWNVGTLAVGQQVSYDIQVQLPVGPQVKTGDTYVNRLAVVSSDNPPTDAGNPCPDNSSQSCVPAVITPHPQLVHTKTVDKATALPGDTLTYTIAVTNIGDAPGGFNRGTDTLPVGVTFVSGSSDSPTGFVSGGPLNRNVVYSGASGSSAIQPGQSIHYTIVVKVNADAWGKRLINYERMLGAANFSAKPCTDEQRVASGSTATSAIFTTYFSCAETVIPVAQPGIGLVKTASAPANGQGFVAGEKVTYTFRATNTGNTPLASVTVTDTAFTNGAGTTVQLDGAPTAPVGFDGTLTPGGSVDFTATYTVTATDAQAGGTLTNTATATATVPRSVNYAGAPPTATSSSQAPVGKAQISLVKTASPVAGAKAGDVVTYRFVATNTGNLTLTDVALTERSFTNGAGDVLHLDAAPTVETPAGWNGSLTPGQSVTWTAPYTVTTADVRAAGSIQNLAEVSGNPPRRNPTDPVTPVTGQDVAIITPAAAVPSIALEKTVSLPANGEAFVEGETASFSFRVTNTGDTMLTGVNVREKEFTDANGRALTLTTGPTAPSRFSGSLNPGESVTFTGTYLITAADLGAGPLTNIATATGTPPTGPDVRSDGDVSVPTAAPRLALLKTSDVATAQPGQVVTYTFAITNTGNITATDVTVSEDSFIDASGHAIALDTPPLATDADRAATLRPGQTVTFLGRHTVAAQEATGALINTATARATLGGRPVSSPPSSAVVTVNPLPSPADNPVAQVWLAVTGTPGIPLAVAGVGTLLFSLGIALLFWRRRTARLRS